MNALCMRCASRIAGLGLMVGGVTAAVPALAQQGGVHVGITLDADSVELIRAWRRAHGLDPADAEADLRARRIVERVRAARAAEAARLAGALQPPERRLVANSVD